MVNAHCHLELSYLRGRIARGCGFAGFADTIARARNETAPQQRIEAAAYWNARMEHDGIVAVGDICNGTSTFELKRNSRIHYHNFIEGFGLRTTDFSFLRRIAAESEALGIDAWAGSFDIGKRPGAVLITGIDWDTLTLLPHAASRRIL